VRGKEVIRHAPAAVALAGFSLYALLVPPGLTWSPGSDLGAAGVELAAAPPPGLPLHGVLASIAALLPVGELAFRVHLLSAAAAALALLLVARLVEGPVRGEPAGALGGAAAALLLGASLTFARQATVTGALAPTVALLAGVLLLFDRVARGADGRAGLLLALLAGLGLGLDPVLRLILPAPIAALLLVRLRRGARWPLLAPLVALAAAAAIHLYIPVRAGAAGDPGGLGEAGALFDHVAPRGEEQPVPAEIARHRAALALGGAADELGALGLVAALLGAVVLAGERRSRWLLLAIAAAGAGDLAGAIWLGPAGQGAGPPGVPLALAIALLAGAAVAHLARWAGRAGVPVAAAAALMIAVGPALVSWPDLAAASRSDAARRFAEAALDRAPTGAPEPSGGDVAGGIRFLLRVERARPDLQPPAGPAPEDRADAAAALLVPASAGPDQVRRAAAAVAALLDGDRDGPARRFAADALTGLARLARRRGDLPLALHLAGLALAARPRHPAALLERGSALARLGRLPAAAAAAELAIAEQPDRVSALLDAARYRLALGEVDRALALSDRARRLAPGDADGWALAGLADARAGNDTRARARLHRALELEPDHAEAGAALRRLDARLVP